MFPNPSDTGSRGHSDPMDVDAVNYLSSGKEKSHRVRVFSSAVEQIFNETAMHARAQASDRLVNAIRGNQSKSQESAQTCPTDNSWFHDVSQESAQTCPTDNSWFHDGSQESAQTCPTDNSWFHDGSLESAQTCPTDNSWFHDGSQESAQTCPTENSWFHDGWGQDEWNDGSIF